MEAGDFGGHAGTAVDTADTALPGGRRRGRAAPAPADGPENPAEPHAAPTTPPAALQLPLFEPIRAPHPLVEELKALDVLTLTPLDALNRLAHLVERARQEGS